MPESPLNKILWNNGKIETKFEKLSIDICLYLLNSYTGSAIELLKKYREALKNETIELPEKLVTD